ncbi:MULTISPECIES: MFS transporter [unclassified Achromobacter]|uniref:MFS transporter n=1 Tax=unclassified Achromobacter TaxID=2626865 RepID=UPI000B5156A0|nr:MULTISPECIES: MFS transporter [unclassified Achromobacter]OWT76797.1 MFS transporter [Achromobacter sp. HZ28]OWT77677.1 MFS transporter [Achromobacter sp. HZ34]
MSSPDTPRAAAAAPGSVKVTGQILSILVFNFLGYLTVGLPMAVLPGYVHNELGYGSVLAGLVISIQYLATLLSRSHAGRMSDSVGPRKTVLVGLAACAASGVFLLMAYAFERSPTVSLVALLLGRLILGFGESWVGTGGLTWGIGKVGAAHTGRVISWSGICTYGALAIGAPLGVLLQSRWSMGAVGAAVLGVGLVGIAMAFPRAPVAVVGGARMAFKHVMAQVLPHGLALGLASVGFGSIATFITLYYGSFQWEGAALALSVFGCAFIGARLLLANMIPRFGGFRVAICSISVEVLGLLCLWLAPQPSVALAGAALTGFGFSLVFPALGVEAVARVPAGNRGAALGAYSVFLDLSLGITGPVVGLAVATYGYPSIFLLAALASVLSIGIITLLLKAARRAAVVRGTGSA